VNETKSNLQPQWTSSAKLSAFAVGGNSLCVAGHRRSLDEIGEERGHLACLLVPFLSWAQVHVVVLREQDMHLGVGKDAG